MSYRECAKTKPECKGLKKGVKGYHGCVKDAGCKKKPKKPPKVPKKPTEAQKARLRMPRKPTMERVDNLKEKVHKKKVADMDEEIAQKKKRNRKLQAKVNAKKNPWLKHLAEFRASNPQFSGKEVMAEAKKTYKK
jgi:4-alpha-glucanotransferase